MAEGEVSMQQLRADWQSCLDMARKRGWWAMATALTEDGPVEGVDYKWLMENGPEPKPIQEE